MGRENISTKKKKKNVQKVWRGICAVHHVERAQQMRLSQMTYEAEELDQLQWEQEQFGEK